MGFDYDNVLSYQYGVAGVIIDNKIVCIDSAGDPILACKFDEGYDCFSKRI